MKMFIFTLGFLGLSSFANAAAVSCDLVYANNGDVQQTSASMEFAADKESPMLELSIKDKVEAQVFRGSNGIMSATVARADREVASGITDGHLLHIVVEIGEEGHALTCRFQD